MDQNSCVLGHVFHNSIKVTMGVVDQTPATSPSRNTIILGKRANANHRYLRVEVRKGNEFSVGIKRQSIVNFITDKRDSNFISQSNNFSHVLLRPAGTTRIRRVVH